MKTNDLTNSCEALDRMVREHPSASILATLGIGIISGVLVRLLYDREHPTRMDTARNAVHHLGDRVRSLFR